MLPTFHTFVCSYYPHTHTCSCKDENTRSTLQAEIDSWWERDRTVSVYVFMQSHHEHSTDGIWMLWETMENNTYIPMRSREYSLLRIAYMERETRRESETRTKQRKRRIQQQFVCIGKPIGVIGNGERETTVFGCISANIGFHMNPHNQSQRIQSPNPPEREKRDWKFNVFFFAFMFVHGIMV